jgi:hypothetical protein
MNLIRESAPLLLFLIGMAAIVLGIFVRIGRLRRWEKMYMDPDAPIWLRNGPLVAIPFGAFSVGAVLSGVLLGADEPWRTVGIAALVLTLLLGVGAMAMLARPPEWLKPRWMRGAEGKAALKPARAPLVFVLFDNFLILLAGLLLLVAVVSITLLAFSGGLGPGPSR